MKGCYVYCCDKALAEYLAAQLEPQHESVPELRIEPEVNDEVKYIDFLPLYSIRAACGYFGEGEIVDETGWMKVEGMGKLNRNMFIVQAVGHSMEPLIHDGDYCVFRANPAGSDKGKLYLQNTIITMILTILAVILSKHIPVRNHLMRKGIGLMKRLFSSPKILTTPLSLLKKKMQMSSEL